MRRLIAFLAAAFVLFGCSDSGGSSLSGEQVATDLACLACHTESDGPLGPSWNGIWGSEVQLEDGTTVTVDADYVIRSIEDPQADIVAGYGPTMPAFPLSAEERDALVEYIESLG